MDWLNYHHLHYFWMVAREGTLTRASQVLRLSPSTVSAQIRTLEEMLGHPLFERRGRRLHLTDMGRTIHRYADEIFALGRELLDAAHGAPSDRPMRLEVGIADVVPKLVAEKLMEPALGLPSRMHAIFHDGKPEQLLGELALHKLDLVLLDAPLGPGLHIRAYNHLLGECDVHFFAPKDEAPRYRKRFPQCLHQAPVLLPLPSTAMRRAIDSFFEHHALRPDVRAEFDDSALMKVFGMQGFGLFPGPAVVRKEIERQYQVRSIGKLDGVRDRFYAITPHRRLKHPAAVAMAEAAREKLFR